MQRVVESPTRTRLVENGKTLGYIDTSYATRDKAEIDAILAKIATIIRNAYISGKIIKK